MSVKLTQQHTLIDLFAGIGGFRIAFGEAGVKCIGFSEIDKKAIKVYKENFDIDDEHHLGDITQLNDVPYADFLAGGVPCQSWSIAGKMKGFGDPRGRLWHDTIKLTERIKPKGFIFENVKGLADPRNRENLDLILSEFDRLGYNLHYRVLNAFDFGLPQSRERIFIVGIRSDVDNGNFSFPEKYSHLPSLVNIMENEHTSTGLHTNWTDNTSGFKMASVLNKGNFFIFSDVRNGDHTIHSWDLIETTEAEKAICLKILRNRRKQTYGSKDGNPMSPEDILTLFGNQKLEGIKVTRKDIDSLVQKNILRKVDGKYEFVNSKISSGINGVYRIFLPQSHVFSTLTKSGSRDYVTDVIIPNDIRNKRDFFLKEIFWKKNYRPITVREGARIQGFPDDFVFNTEYSTALGLLGNSLAVSIAKEVAKRLVSSVK